MTTIFKNIDGQVIAEGEQLPNTFIMIDESHKATWVEFTDNDVKFSPLADDLLAIVEGTDIPVKEQAVKNGTKEITIYTQTNKNNVIKLYCEDCKPQGYSHKGTLVTSCYDHCCDGCGQDFLELAEIAEKEEELSPADIAALKEAMAQPSMGPYTFDELCQLLAQK